MKTIITYFAKKYCISAINDLLKEHQEGVKHITETIHLWIMRLEVIIEELKKINYRVSDGMIEASECDESINEIKTIIDQF